MAFIESEHPNQMDQGLRTSVDLNSDAASGRHWNVFGHSVPKSEIVFFTQVLLIYVVVITSIVNLTVYKNEDEGKMWTALMSSAIGYLLPNPTLKKRFS